MTDSAGPVLVIVWLVFLLIAAGWYLWYAAMLSRVFARLGAESWKAWVPFLNEAEIFRLGGVAPSSAVFYAIPIVQFYALYLKAKATSRINAHFGRGSDLTALAILLPPIWATILARGNSTNAPTMQQRIASSVASAPADSAAALRGPGYADEVSSPPPPVPPAPVPPAPVPPAPVPPQPPAPPTPPAPPLLAPTMPPSLAAAFGTPVAAPPPVVVAPPAAPVAPTLLPPPPTLLSPPLAPLPPAPVSAPPLASLPPAPVPAPAVVAPVPEPELQSPELSVASQEPLGGDADDNADDDAADERTVVVDRRPVVPWRLMVDDGPTFRLQRTSIVLGRKPDGADPAAQQVAVPDDTRTLSKVHARLDLADGRWTITDLNATNGVIVIGQDGSERLLDAGTSAQLTERFVLGKVGMRVVFGEGDAPR